jgi:hypothetical protein
MSDPFAHIDGNVPGAKSTAANAKTKWVPIMPVPADAPPAPDKHPKLGKASARWCYTDAAGNTLGFVLRFDLGGDDKDFRPLTYCRPEPAGSPMWRWQSWPLKRPLYGLRELAERPSVPVVVTEGEKACDAARQLLPDLVVVTSPNGADSAGMADWRPLAGRTVTVWRDADFAGAEYAGEVAAEVVAAGASSVAITSPSQGSSVGWDAADALTEGWEEAQALEFIAAAAPADGAGLDGDALKAREEHGDKCGVTLDDFYAYMPLHRYIFAPSREMWPASSINASLGTVPLNYPDGTRVLDEKGKQKKIAAGTWLDQHRAVEQITWAPGLPEVIPDRLISEGGWIERSGVACFNLYRPPTIIPGNAAEADRWLDHIHKVFGDDGQHIVKYLAHRVQRPQEKINHALVFGGYQGVGKDTILEPVKQSIGPWNFWEVSPQQLLGRFNGFLKSVLLRVSEARDTGEINRFQFYDHMKSYTAAPPDVLRVDEKNLREHSVLNCCGVVITTNHKADGIYLPADDRRHYVAWSECKKEDFVKDYWKAIWRWYANGGNRHVCAYLNELDISDFDPKAPPPKTAAFWDIVDANRVPEDGEMADVLDKLGNPDATTLTMIVNKATGGFDEWIQDRRNRRAIPHRLETCGYVSVRNGGAKDGLWVINGARQVIYTKSELPVGSRLEAAIELVKKATSRSR